MLKISNNFLNKDDDEELKEKELKEETKDKKLKEKIKNCESTEAILMLLQHFSIKRKYVSSIENYYIIYEDDIMCVFKHNKLHKFKICFLGSQLSTDKLINGLRKLSKEKLD